MPAAAAPTTTEALIMTTDPIIYVASRASTPTHAAMWRVLRDSHGWRINSTWIDEAGEGETADFAGLWLRIESEIRACTSLIFYAEAGDFPLKGALVEVGMAIGMGKPVVAVLPDVELEQRSMRPVGSWLHHPMVRRRATIGGAHDWIASQCEVNAKTSSRDDRIAMVLKHLKLGDIITHTRCMGLVEEHKATDIDFAANKALHGRATYDTSRMHHLHGSRGHGDQGETQDIHPANVTHINRIPVGMLDLLADVRRSG
jgi:hypothetical protein